MNHKSDNFYIYRRHLPHWRLIGAVYFVTWRIHPTQIDLIPEEKDIVVNSLRHFNNERYELISYTVMNDHVHVIVFPFDGYELRQLTHSWKSFTANYFQHTFNRKGKVWLDESFDRIIRDEEELKEKIQYIMNNPRKRWPEIESYKWVWCKGMDT